MVFKKAIIQVYSGNEPFGFHDFVRGTLRLLNYTIDRNIDLKVNVRGSEFAPYMIVDNFAYNTDLLKTKLYYAEVDKETLINDLDAFMNTSEPLLVVTSSVSLHRSSIYHMSFVRYDALVRYNQQLYIAANQKVMANLLRRTNSDNLTYGYSIIYIHRDSSKYKITQTDLRSLIAQIRNTVNLQKDIIILSNNIQLQNIVSEYINTNGININKLHESDLDISIAESFVTVEETIIDFIILMKSKKIYRFIDTVLETNNRILYGNTKSVYETSLEINNIIGNLDITLVPLYYQTKTIVGCAKPTPPAFLPNQPGVSLDPSGNYISNLLSPSDIVLDFSGNMYISDTEKHRICKVDTSGNFTVYAGSSNGTAGYVNGDKSVALFSSPTAMAIDKVGNIYVADTGNNVIRIIEKQFEYDINKNIVFTGGLMIATLVGGGSVLASSGEGTRVKLNAPRGIAVDSSGILYISDTGNHRICKITSGGTFQTIAGSLILDGTAHYLSGYINGNGQYASFNSPTAIVVDLVGNIYVTDTGNNVIRRITQNGNVTTVAGSGQPFFKEGARENASFNGPQGIAIDLDNMLYISDTGNNTIRRITPDGDVFQIVGSPDQKIGSIDGYGAVDPIKPVVSFNIRATFFFPTGITIDASKKLYVADKFNNTIRTVTPTFSNPTKIKPIPIQTLKITKGSGVGLTLGPTLSAQAPLPNTIVYGHRKGYR